MDPRSEFAQLPSRRIEKLAWEARARITWGETADSVRDWLRARGADEESVQVILGICLKERGRSLRVKGFRDLVIGAASILLGACAYVGTFVVVGQAQLHIPGRPGRLPGRGPGILLFVLSFMALLFGVHLGFRGCVRLVMGARTRGADSDVGDLSPL